MAGRVGLEALDQNGNITTVKTALSGALTTAPAFQDISLVTLTTATTQTTTTADQVNLGGRGIKLVVDITAISGTGAQIIVTLQGKDVASGKYYSILVSAALTSVATTVLSVYPGLTASANVTASDVLPNIWRVQYAISGTTPSITATIGASVL